ncbi:MAG TPA: ATPase, T2SS/T4P/T4SS family [Acidimicrobiia bacterium]|nr:ATPase, T2SS/T4P/T4SS family [Acidimicrobiia bacterium]
MNVDTRIDAYESLRRAAMQRLERRRLRPDVDPGAVRAEIVALVDEYGRDAELGRTPPLGDPDDMVERVARAIVELGPLTDLLTRVDVEEIFIEGAKVAYLDDRGRLLGSPVPTTEEENRRLVDRLLAATDRHLSARYPIVQARVLDGTARLTAAIPPIADHLSATVRRYTVRDVSLEDLVERGSITRPAANLLRVAARVRSRIVVSGEPGAGKTTMLAAFLAAVPPTHCVRCCEEIRELSVPVAHGGYYEVRPPALDDSGEVTLRDLVKFVLAMRPDRIVVGEVRGAEAFELTRAINAGCGFACTVHANSARGALQALVNAALMAGENVTEHVVRRVFSDALDLVVHLDRDDSGADAPGIRRAVVEIAAVAPEVDRQLTCEPVFARARVGGPLEWTGATPEWLEDRLAGALGRSSLRAVLDGRVTP